MKTCLLLHMYTANSAPTVVQSRSKCYYSRTNTTKVECKYQYVYVMDMCGFFYFALHRNST